MKVSSALLSDTCMVSHALSTHIRPSLSILYIQPRCTVGAGRTLHSSPPKDVAIPLSPPVSPRLPKPSLAVATKARPLSHLPLSQVLRTYFITSISSSPAILNASTIILRHMLESRNPLLRIDSNPILRAILWETFYKQFCAGETPAQVSKTCNDLRQQGYAGVILEYALEVLKDAESNEPEDVATWRKGMLDAIDLASPGDFVGVKWSGMGVAAMRRMGGCRPPSAGMREAMHAVCRSAASSSVALLPAAEETWTLDGFHAWCLDLQRAHNPPGRAPVVYTTYQAYLTQTPATLARHLSLAEAEGFVLGVKLVRGAYLASEKRDLIHPSIEATHAAYDALMDAVLRRGYNDVLRPAAASPSAGRRFPEIGLVIASHNAASVGKAREIRRRQLAAGEALTPTVFAQLQGMADEVSCSLIAGGEGAGEVGVGPREKVLKCTTFGTMYQCLNYLLRRAAENKDAAGRTEESRRAMRAEIVRRVKGGLGFGG